MFFVKEEVFWNWSFLVVISCFVIKLDEILI